MDTDGRLRVGGRLQNAHIDVAVRAPSAVATISRPYGTRRQRRTLTDDTCWRPGYPDQGPQASLGAASAPASQESDKPLQGSPRRKTEASYCGDHSVAERAP